jgi:hypothetical protein
MGTMDMGMSHGGAHTRTSVEGMSMSAAHGVTNILPAWLAVLWTLVFLAIVAVEVRNLLDSAGERRLWHAVLLSMAFGMTFAFAPPSLDHFDIPSGFWQLVFANGALAVFAWMLAQTLDRRAIDALWLLLAIDLAAMAYMWSPGGFQAPLTWLLVAYFAAQALLWAGDHMRNVDRRVLPGGGASVASGGVLAATAAVPLIGGRNLRLAMCAMTLGVAYMLTAMQLAM